MNAKKLVKATNIIGMVAVTLLVYWVFALILIQVFGLKVFREHITEIFLMSILGILAVMGGTLMLNIMLNLTRIAERGQEEEVRGGRKTVYLLLAVFPILAALLFGGNYLTIRQKRDILTQSSERIVKDNPAQLDALTDYRFDLAYIKKSSEILDLMAKDDLSFKSAMIIVQDKIDNKPVYLAFSADSRLNVGGEAVPAASQNEAVPAANQNVEGNDNFVMDRNGEKVMVKKMDYVYSPDLKEREYLQKVFAGQTQEMRYEAEDGHYSLCHPYRKNGKTIVLCFSDYQEYGKIGS
ncbi:peptidase [Neisseria elongata]|uniref:Peptidase n=1 Tax=Neisseria elongata subsp. nitroreducens TaxID=90367 RepID=A0A9X1CYL5_NEIEL|nr:peptidase [Neisseria elongata]MBS9340576.1 peptidase [Neisseria elongata subsp. nitroreducens]